MENKKISLKELRKIVSENAFKILEDNDLESNQDINPEPEINSTNIDDSTPIDKGLEDSSNDFNGFENLSDITKKLSTSIDPKKLDEINGEIIKTLSTGRINKNYNFSKMVVSGVDKSVFDYFVTVLATLYKKADSSEKANIRKAIFLSLPVYNMASVESTDSGDIRSSSFSNLVARKAGIGSFLGVGKTIDASYYLDIVADSIYEAIDYALENYNPERGGTFTSVVLFKAVSNAKDKLGSKMHKKTFAAGGEKSSIDEPLGSSEEERDETKADRITGKEGEVSAEQREAAKEFAGALKTFVQEKLGQSPKYSNYLEFFNLFTQGNSLSEIADIMGKEQGNIRVIKKRMEDFITKFVESGEFQDYIAEETGMKVDFPKNKFSLSVQGTATGTGEVEPVEYFQITGNDPETGEPTGEWVTLTPETHDSETTWFDKYGDLVFGREESPEISSNTSQEEIGDEEENQITESLLKSIQKRIKNNL